MWCVYPFIPSRVHEGYSLSKAAFDRLVAAYNPNLMQMTDHVSYVVTDPKGTIIVECGKMLVNGGYRIKVLNTINFKKSMHYNRATCSLLKRWRTALFQSVL